MAPAFAATVAAAVLACSPGAPDDVRAGAPESSAAASDVPRTADPARRGYGEADFPRVQEIAPGVYTYEALRSAGEERFATVSLFVVGERGVLVADGQGNAEETGRLLAAVAEVTDLPVTHVVVGSDHGDHTGGNEAFPREALFLVHPTSAATLGRDGAGGAEPALGPNVELVAERTVVDLGGREVHVLFLGRAHTGGDLVVHLPAEGVLFMSEAYLNRVFPAMRSAYPSEWVAMIERAQALEPRIPVPGHGFVESPAVLREELETYRRALETVIAEGRRLHAAGVPPEEAEGQARLGELEGWSLRSSQAGRALQRVYLELEGGLAGGG